jgi:PAP2 superfamily protein
MTPAAETLTSSVGNMKTGAHQCVDVGLPVPTSRRGRPSLVDMNELRSSLSRRYPGSIELGLAVALYALYEVVRGFGSTSLSLAQGHTDDIVALERSSHIFVERSVQDAAHSVPGLPPLLGFLYLGLHLIGTALALVWVYRRHPDRFPLVRTTIVVATALSLVIYVFYPAAPPRLAGLGFADTVTHSAHLNLSSNLLGSFYNPFAAVPSLHFGYSLLVGAAIYAYADRRWTRVAGALYPALMLFIIVATGNHFLFDAAAGGLVVAASWLVARRIIGERTPARRRVLVTA